MSNDPAEDLIYGGESPENAAAYRRYLSDVQRGKSLLQLSATAHDVTPDVRRCWSPRSFTAVKTSASVFDAVVCNVAYHFHKHGQKYGSVRRMTDEARQLFQSHRHEATQRKRNGLLQFPDGSLFEIDGRIVTFVG